MATEIILNNVLYGTIVLIGGALVGAIVISTHIIKKAIERRNLASR